MTGCKQNLPLTTGVAKIRSGSMSVVTLKEILQDTAKRKYGVGLFNMLNLEMGRGIIRAAEAEQSPVILGVAEVHTSVIPFEYAAHIMLKLAREAKVPVCLHLDHGMSRELLFRAIDSQFTSVMFDGSSLGFADNIAGTRAIVEYARKKGVSVEAELGHVGGSEDGSQDSEILYTEVNKVPEFIERTGVDALAVAIGTVHGKYLKTPRLDMERLRAINKVSTVPLVLHGGSGLSDEDFRNTIQSGIRKINICTDMCVAAAEAAQRAEITSYEKIIPAMMDAVQAVVTNKIRLFGSNNKV